jgi:uncharacterized membrane protein
MSSEQGPLRLVARRSAPRRYTSATLTGGVVVAGICFAVAMVAELLGADVGAGAMTDVGAVVQGLFALTPWAWATAGAYAIVITPVAGLLVTAAEYWRVDDRRTVLLAVAVLAVLTVSAVVAILR